MSSPARVSVVVEDGHLDRIEEVAAALSAGGMRVEQVLDGIGVITGAVPHDRRDGLAGVPGVATVTEEQAYRIPPPDSPVQ